MRNNRLILIIILLLAAMNPLIGNLYLPSLPSLQQALHTTIDLAQLTLTFSALGAAGVQLIYGPLSDALGRRKVLLAGLAITALGSLLCVLAKDIYLLLLGRLIQGIGSGCTLALPRAITRDRFSGAQLSKTSSIISIVKIAALNLAALVGGYIEQLFSWHTNFLVILVYVALTLLVVFILLPETNQQRHYRNLKLTVISHSFTILVSHRGYIGSCIFIACCFAALYSWLTVSPILFIHYIGLAPWQYGWVMASSGVIYITSMLFNIYYVSRLGTARMITIGLLLTLIGAAAMLILATLHNWLTILPTIYIFIAGIALMISNSISTALSPFGKIAGFASAILSTCQLGSSALASAIVAILGLNSQLALGTILLILMAIALLVKLTLHRASN